MPPFTGEAIRVVQTEGFEVVLTFFRRADGHKAESDTGE
jgi:hypothetical protein